jgi:hypothetical protein
VNSGETAGWQYSNVAIRQMAMANSNQQTANGKWQHRGKAGISAWLASGQGRHQHKAGIGTRPVVGSALAL